MTRSHTTSTLALALLLPWSLVGCPGAGEEDGGDEADGTGTSGGEAWCFDLGSDPGLEGVRAPKVPHVKQLAGLTCADPTWADGDTPQLDPSWVVDLGVSDSPAGLRMVAHPGGGVVVFTRNLLARYSADGEQLWAKTSGYDDLSSLELAIAPDGALIVAASSWDRPIEPPIERFDDNGDSLGPVPAPFLSPTVEIWGLAYEGEDLLIACFDTNLDSFLVPTFLRVAPDGTEILRKSSPSVPSGAFAVTQSGQALFGNVLLSTTTGAIAGTLTLSNSAFPDGAVGLGDDIVATGSSGDLTLARVSAFGGERWLREHDRVGNTERGVSVGATPAGGVVVVGSERLLVSDPDAYWVNGQPLIIGADGDGGALWLDRVAVLGVAVGVAASADGAVYVAGYAELDSPAGSEENPGVVNWVRRYDP